MSSPASRERGFATALRVLSVLSIVCVLCYVFTGARAHHEMSQPESVVAAQSSMLAHDGTLYYSLKDYPYTVCAYMPIFYFLEAAGIRVGMPALLMGRLISLAALLSTFLLCWRIVLLYTGNRYAAWIAVLLASCSTLILNWGTIAQVDMLAVTFSLAGFYQFSRYYVKSENTLLWAGLFAFAAFFTKQTMLAAPAAMFVLLLFRKPKTALIFGAGLGASVAVAALGINAALHGRFFADTVFANINPFDIEKLTQHLKYMGLIAGSLVATVAIALPKLVRSRSVALVAYFGFAATLFLLLASKVGSDSNYQLEPTLLLILCSSAGLVELNIFDLVFNNSKSYLTLIQGLILLFMVQNYRIAIPETIGRYFKENLFRAEMAAVEPYLKKASGRVFSTDLDPVVQARGRLDIEPLIYGLLVNAGRIDPEPVRQDFARAAFPVVILYEDVDHPIPDSSLEIARIVPPQLTDFKKNYRLAEHIQGPYLGGIYVYLPIPADH